MNDKVFYIHTAKCGGHSILKCLQELNVDYVNIKSLKLDLSTIDLLKSNRKLIVFGHVDKIQRPQNQNELHIFEEISRILYFRFNLIMPTRNPANLLQSWMHYSKTRVNKMLSDPVFLKSGKVVGTDSGMMHNVINLKQNVLTFTNKKIKILQGDSEPPMVILEEEDEEDNLHLFIDYLKKKQHLFGTLCPMMFQLNFFEFSKLARCMTEKIPFSLHLPRSDDHRCVCYYDCENLSTVDLHLFSEVIHPEFGDRLINTHENASSAKNLIKASNIISVVSRLKKITPNEWVVYNQSQGSKIS